MMNTLAKKLCGLILTVLAMPALAESWTPTRPITVFIGQTPGSGNEVVFRRLADSVTSNTGAKFLIEHRPGLDGVLAWNALGAGLNDGYSVTVQALETSLVALPIQYPHQLQTDPNRAITVMPLASTPEVWAVRHDSDIRDLDDLIKAYQSRRLNVGISGSVALLAHNMLQDRVGSTNREIQAVRYKSIPSNLVDLATGSIDVSVVPAVGARSLVQSGKIKIIAVADDRPLPSQPSVPLMKSRLQDFVVRVSYTLFAPAGTPPEVLAWYQTHFGSALGTDEFGLWTRQQDSLPFADPSPAGAASYTKNVKKHLDAVARKHLSSTPP